MGSLSLGSLTDSIGSESLGGGSSTEELTDKIADSVGDMVSTALKTFMGNMS